MGRKRSKKGGGGGGGRSNSMSGFLLIVFGCVAMLVCLIMFGIAIGSLDDAMTTAATYATEMPGLVSVMGIWGLVIFLAFMTAGLGALAGGTYVSIKGRMGGGWMDMLMLAIMGGVTIVIALVMNGLIISQLHTAIQTANTTVNVASFTGLVSLMGIFGMVIFLSLMAAGLAMITGAAWGSYKKVKGG